MVTTKNDDASVPDEPDLGPPKGYESWLECAVAMFDARAVLGPAFDDAGRQARRQVQAGVWAEFNALRSSAGLTALEPKGLMRPRIEEGSSAEILQKTESKTVVINSRLSAEQDQRSLLDMLNDMPRTDGVEFYPPNIDIELKLMDFGSKD